VYQAEYRSKVELSGILAVAMPHGTVLPVNAQYDGALFGPADSYIPGMWFTPLPVYNRLPCDGALNDCSCIVLVHVAVVTIS
jgi:hypothetical protein